MRIEAKKEIKVSVIWAASVEDAISLSRDVVKIMELGFDGVLLNSSVARSLNPVEMSEAMKLAVLSGRKGFNSGTIEKSKLALGSTSFKGKISNF